VDFQLSENSSVVAAKGQVSADLSGEVVILNLESGMYYGLDAVGARIWDLVQTPRTVHDIRNILLDEYEVEAKRCEQDLLALLQSLIGEGLVEVKNEKPV
jgi:hypothetical protein